MPKYKYRAFTAEGNAVKGDIEAATESEAFAQLRDRGLVPASIGTHDPSNLFRFFLSRKQKYDKKSLAKFSRMMANLCTARIPLVDAVSITLDNTPSGRFRRKLDEIRESIVNGASLSEALVQANEFSPNYYCSLIAAGERSGSLSNVLNSLTERLEHELEVTKKVQSGLIYPGVLFAVAIAVLAVVIGVLIPAVKPLFESAGSELPQAVSLIDDTWIFIRSNILVIAVITIGSTLLMLRILLIKQVKAKIDRLMLSLPIFGKIITGMEFSRFTGTVGMMLANGVPLMDAMEDSKKVFNRQILSDSVSDVTGRIRHGESLTEAIESIEFVPSLLPRMIQIGEETGTLPLILNDVGRVLESEVLTSTALLLQLLPPILTLIIGIGVGGVVFLIMNAIMSFNALVL